MIALEEIAQEVDANMQRFNERERYASSVSSRASLARRQQNPDAEESGESKNYKARIEKEREVGDG